MTQVFVFYPIYRPEITHDRVLQVARQTLESRGWAISGDPTIRVERNPDREWLPSAAPQRYVLVFEAEPPAPVAEAP